jgi:hypothetical protein
MRGNPMANLGGCPLAQGNEKAQVSALPGPVRNCLLCTSEGAGMVLGVSSQAEAGEPFDDGRDRFSALW